MARYFSKIKLLFAGVLIISFFLWIVSLVTAFGIFKLFKSFPNKNSIILQGTVCGTIDGIACPDGYECRLEDESIDDGAGVCVKIVSSVNPVLGDAVTIAECKRKGGVWGKWGILAQEYCQVPSSDYMDDCTDGSQCQYGRCIAAYENKLPGKCQKFPNVFGCMSIVENGKIATSLCVD